MAGSDQRPRPAPCGARDFRLLLAVLALLLIVLFSGLGTWQVFRLQWKLDLIARVDARVHAVQAPPPSAARWAASMPSDEYRRVELHGTYLYEFTTPVQALTEQGAGYWLLTPLCGTDGHIVIVNRGFIPAVLGSRTRYDARRAGPDACAAAGGHEPSTRWSACCASASRTAPSRAPTIRRTTAGTAATSPPSPPPAAWARLRHTSSTPPRPEPGRFARPAQGGLTVISFPNSHLVYAITWYALALMVLGAWWWLARAAPTGMSNPGEFPMQGRARRGAPPRPPTSNTSPATRTCCS
jgi:surfeit locus 1 family protein